MSSNIRIQRICQHCGNEFIAKRITSLYCSHKCNTAAYKAGKRTVKIEANNKQVEEIKIKPIEQIKAKEFLSVRDVATLLNFSLRTTYRLIKLGKIRALNFAERKTLVRRADIDKLFSQTNFTTSEPEPAPVIYELCECYSYNEIQAKYGISLSALHNLIKRNGIEKIQKGKFAYIPKILIDNLFR